MKKFIKIISIIIIFVLSLSLILSGCGVNESKRKLPGWVEGKKNIIYYTWGDTYEINLLQEIVDNFNNLEGNEEINVVIQRAENDYYGDLMNRFIGKNAPDIVLMKPGEISPFLSADLLEPLDSYIADGSIKAEDLWEVNNGYKYNATTDQLGDTNGKLYALIKDFSPDFALVYNYSLVSESYKSSILASTSESASGVYTSDLNIKPMSFSEFYDLAVSMGTTNVTGTDLDNEKLQQLIEWIQMSGGSLWSADNKKIVDIQSTAAVNQAFNYFRKLQDTALNSNAPAPYTTSSTTRGGYKLVNGQTASLFIGRWAYLNYGFDEMEKIGFSAPPVPDNYTGTKPYAGVTAMVANAITSTCEYKQEAYKFIEYYFNEASKGLAEEGYNIPGNKTVTANYYLTVTDAKTKAINEFYYNLALNAEPLIFNKYLSQSNVENIMSSAFSSYFGKAGRNDTDWNNCLDKIETEIQRELDRTMNLS
jgi:hypothetical protein